MGIYVRAIVVLLAIIILATSQTPATANTLEQVLRRLEALETSNTRLETSNARLEKENTALRDRFRRLEKPRQDTAQPPVGRVVGAEAMAAAPAQRATLGAPAAYAAPWAGAYIGGFAGIHRSHDVLSSDEYGAFDEPRDQRALKPGGFVGGGLVGANFQQGSWVWGVELDGGYVSGKDSLVPPFSFDLIESRIRANAHGRVRVGYAWGNVLPFIAGGVAYANQRITFLRNDDPNFIVRSTRQPVHRVGFTIGGGFDWVFAPNWIARAEYLFDQYSPGSFAPITQAISDNIHVESRTHIARAALIYKFGDTLAPMVVVTKY